MINPEPVAPVANRNGDQGDESYKYAGFVSLKQFTEGENAYSRPGEVDFIGRVKRNAANRSADPKKYEVPSPARPQINRSFKDLDARSDRRSIHQSGSPGSKRSHHNSPDDRAAGMAREEIQDYVERRNYFRDKDASALQLMNQK